MTCRNSWEALEPRCVCFFLCMPCSEDVCTLLTFYEWRCKLKFDDQNLLLLHKCKWCLSEVISSSRQQSFGWFRRKDLDVLIGFTIAQNWVPCRDIRSSDLLLGLTPSLFRWQYSLCLCNPKLVAMILNYRSLVSPTNDIWKSIWKL
jgi:hypothetical protein